MQKKKKKKAVMLLPTITIQELLIEPFKALGCFQQDPAMGKVIKGHQDIFGVPPNIYNLKEKYVYILAAQERLLFVYWVTVGCSTEGWNKRKLIP